MSKFLSNTKIVELSRSNNGLHGEIESLHRQISRLKSEVERLSGHDADSIDDLRERLAAFEQQDRELKEKVEAICQTADESADRDEVLGQLLSLFPVEENDKLKVLLTQRPQSAVEAQPVAAFAIGAVSMLACWFAVDYINGGGVFSSLLALLS